MHLYFNDCNISWKLAFSLVDVVQKLQPKAEVCNFSTHYFSANQEKSALECAEGKKR